MPIEIHAPKLSAIVAAAFNSKRADNLTIDLHDPEGIALGFREHILQVPELAIEGCRDVLLEYFAHVRRRQFAVDARPERCDWLVVRPLVRPKAGSRLNRHHDRSLLRT